jgi:DNA-binding LytR/AlgR family response regulator
MNNMEEKLNPDKFARVHRSYIVNISCIKEIQPWSHGDYIIVLNNNDKINLSRRYKNRLMP